MGLVDKIRRMPTGIKIICAAVAVVVIAAAVICIVFARKGYIATTMRLLRVEGTVNIEDSKGGTKQVFDNLRFQSGDALNTGADGLASVGLDDTKIITLQNDSRVEFKKKNKQLELNLTKGALFFEVTEKLKEDETFEIKTSTMTAGIRGTSGYVYFNNDGRDSIIITDGAVIVQATNPKTGESKYAEVKGGQGITVYLYDESTEEHDTVEFTVEDVDPEDLNEFTLDRLAENEKLLDKVCEYTGWDKEELIDFIDKIRKGEIEGQEIDITPSPTPGDTPDETRAPTPEPDATVTPTPQVTLTVTPTVTPKPNPTSAPTATPTVRPGATVTPTAAPTAAPTATPKATVTPTVTPKATVTPTVTPTAKPTVSPTVSPSATPKPSTATPTATTTPSPTATVKPTASPSPSASPSPTITVTVTPTTSPTPTTEPSEEDGPTVPSGYTKDSSSWGEVYRDRTIYMAKNTDGEYIGYKDGDWISLFREEVEDGDIYIYYYDEEEDLYYEECLSRPSDDPPSVTEPNTYDGPELPDGYGRLANFWGDTYDGRIIYIAVNGGSASEADYLGYKDGEWIHLRYESQTKNSFFYQYFYEEDDSLFYIGTIDIATYTN